MNKRIRSFESTGRALFINLEDRESSVCVSLAEGTLLLFEGAGNDRYHGALISPEDFLSFALNITADDQWEVLLHFGKGKTHCLGVTEKVEEATQWLRKAAKVIRSHAPPQGKTVSSPLELVGK